MERLVKAFFLLVMKILLLISLASCRAISPNYLDDNYSDRIELAHGVLGKESVYFDVSRYSVMEAEPVELGSRQSPYIQSAQGGGPDKLMRLLVSLSPIGGKVAVSGNESQKAAQTIVDAVTLLPEGGLQNIQILYIGERQFSSDIKSNVEAKLGRFLFRPKPITSSD